MSLRRRFINVARAEVSSWFRRFPEGEAPRGEPAFAASSADSARREHDGRDPITQDIARYYANLELPVGASADEVRAAYKRLMRRYHPDHHLTDDTKAEAATQLARELRHAYESLLHHLGSK